MFGLGPMEMTIIGVLAVLLFGSRLPSVARSLGSTFVEFKRGLKGIDEDTKGGVGEVARELHQVRNDFRAAANDLHSTALHEIHQAKADLHTAVNQPRNPGNPS